MEMSHAKKTILMKNPSILFLSAYEFLKLSFFLFSEILASFFTRYRYPATQFMTTLGHSPHNRCPSALAISFIPNEKG